MVVLRRDHILACNSLLSLTVSKTMGFTNPEGLLTNKGFLGVRHIFKFGAYNCSCHRSKLLSELITHELALFHASDKDLPNL